MEEQKITDKEIEELKAKSKEYADSAGIKLNPSEKMIQGIIKGLLMNKKLKGELYCPCRRVTGNMEEDKKIICPCVFHMQEIKEQGRCHCGLFVA